MVMSVSPWQQAMNAQKPEGVAPNQGGKYVGFGSAAGADTRSHFSST